MDGPSTGSRKRPFEAITGRGGATDAGVIDLSSESSDGIPRVGGMARRRAAHQHSQAVSVDDGDGVCNSDGDEGNDDYDDCRDVAEVSDLRKALGYLVSERDVEGIYNGCSGQPKPGDTSQSNLADATKGRENDEQLRMIPNLVNRILMEHYSNNPHKQSASSKNITRRQEDTMTQLLLAVIVEFSEPYFARVARRRQRERAALLRMQEQRKRQTQDKGKRAREEPGAPQDAQSPDAFDDRAVSWATSCIDQLLQPPAPVVSNGSASNDGNSAKQKLDDPRIPELDALLATSGPHDGLELEEQMQSALMHGLQARRRLRDMGML